MNNIGIFPRGGELPEMFAEYFSGKAYLNMLTEKGVSIGNVTFEPGCRNNWHIHHKGGQNSARYCTAQAGIRLRAKKQ